jgi:hypothetical protein
MLNQRITQWLAEKGYAVEGTVLSKQIFSIYTMLPYTYRELVQLGQAKASIKLFNQQFEQFLRYRVLRRGYLLECPYCATSYWYELTQITEPLECIGCCQRYILPLEIPTSFRLNSLWANLVKNGGLSVLFATRLLQQRPATEQQAGLLCQKNGQTVEIDLLIGTATQIIALVECKDALPDLPKVQEQLTKLKIIADELGAACYLATLEATLPAELAAWIKEREIRVLLRGELVG